MALKSKSTSTGPVVLVILDGWGIAPDGPGNAVSLAETPTMDKLWQDYPHTTLTTSGLAVGLPAGQMGNSEVGHLNIGAGFVVDQWITRIDKAIADSSIGERAELTDAIDRCRARGGALHLLGLIGDGGVHSHSDHLVALVAVAALRGMKRVYVHAFTDGRDTLPTASGDHIRYLQDHFQRMGVGRIVTVTGRYFAMDRDKRWDRTQAAYDVIVDGAGRSFTSALACVETWHREDVTDEFIPPSTIVPPGASPITLGPEDTAIFFNFRSDRGRQLSQALANPDFSGFARAADRPGPTELLTMTRYMEDLNATVIFEEENIDQPLARVISEAGLSQLHVAETEKYAHVTFFLNGGQEEPFTGEDRVLVPSPKVATYDLQPEMSAAGVCKAVVEAFEGGRHRFIVVNFANGDMVGHTGVIPAAVKAIETVDACLGQIVDALNAAGGSALIIADHGNAEEEIDRATGGPMTAHTTNPVPCVLVTPETSPLRRTSLRSDAALSSVAPTILRLLDLDVPSTMVAPSLLA
ncbi:MAG: 2,3-bisphosphoglycerate-independent phosphoglycerate mutase [Thermomicrobiales bacterium]